MRNINVVGELKIRPVCRDDFDSIKNLIDSLLNENINVSISKRRINKFIKDSSQIYLIAEIQDQLVAIISAEKLSRIEDNSLWIELFVNADWRRKGIGDVLLKELIKESKSIDNLNSLVLSVNRKNTAAIYLYSKYKFVRNSTLINVIFPIINMELKL